MGFAVTSRNQAVATLANGVETPVGNVAVQVLAASSSARSVIIQNTGANAVRIGAAGVTATTGFRLATGVAVVFDAPAVSGAAIFAIRETADSTVLAQIAS